MKSIIKIGLVSAILITGFAIAQNDPTPPPASVRPADMEKVIEQEFVIKQDDHVMHIKIDDQNGEKVDIKLNLEEGKTSKIAEKILAKLKEKGLLEGDNVVIETEGIESLAALENLEALEGLESLKELEKLEKLDRDISMSIHSDIDTDGLKGAAIIVPVLGIIAVFGTPILIVYLILRAATRRKELMHENINKLLEQGRDIPPELMAAYQQQNSPEADLYSGIRLSLVGVAIFIALGSLAGFDVGSIGFIPMAIGLARVITWKIQENKKNAQV